MLLHSGPNFNTSTVHNPRKHCYKTLIPQFNFNKSYHSTSTSNATISSGDYNRLKCPAFGGIGVLAAAVVLSTPPPSEETLSNIPQNLSGNSCDSSPNLVDCEETKVKRIQKPKSRNAESCTSKCVTTCTRGGEGSPGEGPLNVRGPIVVFKPGFRSRQYCLVECSDICNLLDDASKGR